MVVTVTTAANTTTECYDALQTLIGNATNWFAWIDDVTYVESGGDKCVACFGTSGASKCVFRNDGGTWYHYRNLGYGGAVCKIPANTQFKVILMPSQPSV